MRDSVEGESSGGSDRVFADVARPVRPLVKQLYEIVDQLEELYPGRSFTPDGHLVGSLGECLAASAFGLTLNTASEKGYDAELTGRDLKIEIKATQGTRVALSAAKEIIADHLLVLVIDRNGDFDVVYNGPAAPAWAVAGKAQKNGQRPISINKLRLLDQDVEDADRLVRSVPVPDRSASIDDIWDFALTFDGYRLYGFDRLGEVANAASEAWIASRRNLPETLEELRMCLFFEQRRWHHFGEEPTGSDAQYISELVDGIRELSAGTVEDHRPISL